MALKDTSAGAAIYFPLFLRYVYDPLVLGLYCPCAWEISSKKLRKFFNDQIFSGAARSTYRNLRHNDNLSKPCTSTCRMLDIGVGSGYFLRQSPIPRGAEVTLVDLNQSALQEASSRMLQAHPTVSCKTSVADFLDPSAEGLSCNGPNGCEFDIISVMLLLHCVPGPPARKAEALIRLGRLLASDGKIFGATILGKGVKHNLMGRVIMFWHNLLGVFGNTEDDMESFVLPLRDAFEGLNWEVCGTMLLFEARKPKAGTRPSEV